MRQSEELFYNMEPSWVKFWLFNITHSVKKKSWTVSKPHLAAFSFNRLNDCLSDRTGSRSVTYNKNKPTETLYDCWNDYTAGTAGEAYVGAFFILWVESVVLTVNPSLSVKKQTTVFYSHLSSLQGWNVSTERQTLRGE